MIRELIREQQQYLQAYFDRFDCKGAEKILHVLKECRGTVVFCGVGKSGHIAQKIAATFLSTGTKAFFLDPTHAVHGDLGYVGREDVLLIFSKSGETRELLDLLPFVEKRGAKTVAVVSEKGSRLAQQCDYSMILPVEKELCPFDLAPTTSTAVQLLFGDCLAIALMRLKQVSLEEYALNHPGGLIGRRITLKIADVMLSGDKLPLCRPTDRLFQVLPELSAKRCGCLLVADGDVLLGIFTDGDLRRCLASQGPAVLEFLVEDLMTKNPRTGMSGQLVGEAMRQMEEDSLHPITVLPIVDDERLVGLVRLHDILKDPAG